MAGPRWAPPGKVARSCRASGWGMCDLCDEWADLTLDDEDPNFAFCADCHARFQRDRLKEQLRQQSSAGQEGRG